MSIPDHGEYDSVCPDIHRRERDAEIERLRQRVAELETQLSAFPPHSEIDRLHQRVAELEARLEECHKLRNSLILESLGR